MKQLSVNQIKDIFMEDLKTTTSSEYTIRNYRIHINFLYKWLLEKRINRISDVTEEVMSEFKVYLQYFRMKNGQKFRKETLSHYISSLKRFFRFCLRRGYILSDPSFNMKRPPYEKQLPRVILTKDEVEKILAIPDTSTVMGFRNRCIFELLYSTGIRNSELRNLTLGDIDTEKSAIRIINGKGKVDRIVPMGKTALQLIEEYIQKVRPILKCKEPDTENADINYPLFISRRSKKMSAFALRKMVYVHMKKSGLTKRVSAHTFRHSIATHLLENGMNVRYIQQFLGHKALSSTQIYTKVTVTDLKKMHHKFHPRER